MARWLIFQLDRALNVERLLKGNQVLDVRMIRVECPVFASGTVSHTMGLSVALQVPIATRRTLFVLNIGFHSACQNPSEIVELPDVAVVSQGCPSCTVVPSSNGSDTKESVGREIRCWHGWIFVERPHRRAYNPFLQNPGDRAIMSSVYPSVAVARRVSGRMRSTKFGK